MPNAEDVPRSVSAELAEINLRGMRLASGGAAFRVAAPRHGNNGALTDRAHRRASSGCRCFLASDLFDASPAPPQQALASRQTKSLEFNHVLTWSSP
ncbi:hypothetical protein PsYK624_117320 [Phanerochaete sordida]|uniref:Uncharacterized protein n=1 Tax=Phanerochaete sordida TaxID=48140 RepID=A0A9P3LHH7_9APHY|nr:hypothetical protein PsYK624_117320 [Phanerochaete sordida]